MAGGEGELEVVAAGGAGEVEHFAGEEEVGGNFGFEGAGVHFGEFDSPGGDHGFLEAAGGIHVEAGVFEAFGEAVDLRWR